MNSELKGFIGVYKKEFRKWEHGVDLPRESIEVITANFHQLNSDNKEWVMDMVLRDLKYAYTNHTAIQDDIELAKLQKKRMIELKIFIVKFFVIVFGGSVAVFGALYVFSEIIKLATSPGDFFSNFSKYVNILVQ